MNQQMSHVKILSAMEVLTSIMVPNRWATVRRSERLNSSLITAWIFVSAA